MPLAAAITGTLGAAGAIGSSMIQSSAASKASQAQVAMQQQALAQQQALYSQGLGTAKDALNPFIQGGQSVLPTLQGLITPGPNQTALLSQTPGFQFRSEYGTMAATNALASRGLGASAGPLATAVSQYNQGLAQDTWQSVVQALQGYAGMGEQAGATLGSAALNGSIQQGQNVGNTLTGIGQSQAQGILGSANALASGVGGITNSLSTAALLSGAGGGGGLYGNIGGMPATGAGAPGDLQSNLYAISQGINPFSGG